jgi:hypothetical protein
MSDTQDRLYDLLPVVYRQRDEEAGGPLRAMLSVIAEQVNLVDADIQRLYDNLFIETCQDWVVPYIGDLVGYQVVHGAGDPADVDSDRARMRNRFLIPRPEVANTLRNRRRRGTLSVLEDLAWDTARWPVKVLEFETHLAATQSLNCGYPDRGRISSLRDNRHLLLGGTMRDLLARTPEVRRGDSKYDKGRYGLGQVGVFVARLKPYTVTHTEAFCMEEVGNNCFTFSPIGQDIPLFYAPIESRSFEPSDPGLPQAISIADLEEYDASSEPPGMRVSAKYYGEEKSFAIFASGWSGAGKSKLVPRERIIPMDLKHWHDKPRPGTVAIDPSRGRIIFPPTHVPESVWVTFHHGFSEDLGAGEYTRTFPAPPADAVIYRVCKDAREEHNHLRDALHRWKHEHPVHGIIEFQDSSVYGEEHIEIELEEHQTLEIRAIDGAMPVLRIVEWQTGRPNGLIIHGAPHSKCSLDGLMVTGRGLQIKGMLEQIAVRRCTLVPGWGIHSDGKPRYPSEPSILLSETRAHLIVENSIIGAIHVLQIDPRNEPNQIAITDSILDATSTKGAALCAPGSETAYAELRIVRSTVIGSVEAHALRLAENSIFTSKVGIARQQSGCVRFCSLSPSSFTPSQFDCQPISASAGLAGEPKDEALASLRPVFTSTRYGTPGYCQLSPACPPEILTGADDDSEMGVFHDLFQPQREANLRTRLDQYLPANTSAAILWVN